METLFFKLLSLLLLCHTNKKKKKIFFKQVNSTNLLFFFRDTSLIGSIKNIKKWTIKLTIVLLVFQAVSCSPIRRLASDQVLYNNEKFQIDQRGFDKSNLKRYQRITKNRRIVGFRFHLFIYNLANPDKNKFPHSWFRRIGEPPVIFDSLLVQQNVKNFEKYLSDIGFDNAVVDYSFKDVSDQKINTIYDVSLGDPIIIKDFQYHFEDTSIQRYIYSDTSDVLIGKGSLFNKPLLQQERLRIERNLKDNGYYKFSKEYIFYEVEDAKIPNAVNVTMHIKQNVSGYIDPVLNARPHKKYYINKVIVNPNVGRTYSYSLDTFAYKGYEFLTPEKTLIHPSTLVAASRIDPGKLYSLSNVNKTYSNLSSLDLFRFININFIEKNNSQGQDSLDAVVELAMRKRQSYAIELTSTYSAKDFGARGSVTYNNYNLFRGGELFQLGVSGSYESLRNRRGIDPLSEIGVSSKFETPKFFLPFYPVEFQQKYSPRTAFGLSYNYQDQHLYTRTIANTSINYNWKGNTLNKHSVYPIDFYLVKLPKKDTAYVDSLNTGRIGYSFENHSILAFRYFFQYSSQSKGYNQDFVYFHSNIEQAGIVLNKVNKWSDWGVDSMLFGVKYAQYVRADIDFRQFKVVDKVNRIVYRLYGGIGIPYGNSKAMPFEKMFWAGGPFGIRAWNDYSLGPGAFPVPKDPSFINKQVGDIKLEANFEYRFKMFWILEGALFADIGNIWLLKEDSAFPNGEFKFDRFYKELAVGSGFGFRFDLSFIILRTDFGFKVHDPSIQDDGISSAGEVTTGSRWTFKNPDVDFWAPTFQFGIGYPF